MDVEHTSRTAVDSAAELPAPRSTLLAWAGVLGPVLLTAAFVVQEALRRDEYSPVAEPVSALEAARTPPRYTTGPVWASGCSFSWWFPCWIVLSLRLRVTRAAAR